MNDKNKTYDAYGNEVVLTSEDFTLIQNKDKIADEKFQTKTTTFAKDAFKRFCKNKSSVVGAIIIGLLLILSIFVPLFSGNDVSKTTYPEQALLPPKLFKTGTGWWDGTKHYKNQVYDFEAQEVAGGSFKNDCIVLKSLNLSEKTTINQAVSGAHYGTLLVIQSSSLQVGVNPETQTFTYQTGNTVSLSQNDALKINVKFGNVSSDTTEYGNIVTSKYKFYVLDTTTNTRYYSGEFKSQGESDSFDVKQILTQNNVAEIQSAKFGFEILPSTGSSLTYLGINSINFDTTNIFDDKKALFENFNILDANAQVLTNIASSGEIPANYWQPSNAIRKVYAASIQYASFDYDEYASKLGSKNLEIAIDRLNEWKEDGWYEETDVKVVTSDSGSITITSKVKVLNDKCPLVDGSTLTQIKLKYWQKDDNGKWGWQELDTYRGDVLLYKYNGYKSMPSFIFGTTDAGYDLFTLAFYSLRTSLLLAIVVFAINFTIGLVWGSISGYFGGNIDLIMERITDILNGMPFIVVVTLCILHLGNNVVTFAIALCLTGWIGTAARTRTQFYRFKGREYVLASRTLGASDARLIFKHVLPNALGTIVTGAVLMIPSVIFSEATLAYLNLGLQGSASFGVLLSNNQQYLSSYPMLIVIPAIIISLLMISFNLFGNGLRDALNPSLKGSD